MKILNLKINNFGKLENTEIKLKEGINVIYGKNESGKSTLLKFIMGMLYGISKNKNGKHISDYERYTPWNGGEFSGKISYELDDGTKYEVFRDFKKKNPNIFNEELEDISKKFHIDKTAGNQFFYDQTKVDEELFLSTIVSLQEEVKLDEKEQNTLTQKMSNLVSTGEDNVSYQKIMAKLNKKQIEEIGTSRSQDRPINLVKKRMEQIEEEKEKFSNISNKKYQIEEEKTNLEKRIKEQENELELLKKVKKVIENQEIEKQKLKINDNAIKEYNRKIEKIKENETKENNNKILNIEKERKSTLIAIITFIIFTIISIISLAIIKNDIISAISIVISILSIIYFGYEKYRNKIQYISNATRNKKENKKNEIEILKAAIQNLQKETKQEKENLKKQYEDEIEKIRNEYLGIIPIKVMDEILAKKSVEIETNLLQNKINDDKIKLHTIVNDKKELTQQMENLLELEEEYTNLEEQYEELSKNSDLINMAKEEIEKSYEMMKKNITPQFTNNLSEIIQKISSRKIQKYTTR